MTTEEIITLENKGNDKAFFEFILPKKCSFKVTPLEGFVEKYKKLDVVVKYTPKDKQISKGEQLNVTFAIENGEDKYLKWFS